MPRVREVMANKVSPVASSTPIIEVAHRIRLSGSGVIPMCDNGTFRGVILERDIVTRVVADALDPVTQPALSIANADYPLVSPDADVLEAAQIMATSGVRVLPVVDRGRLVGLLTLDDLAQRSPVLAAMACSRPGQQPHRAREGQRREQYVSQAAMR